MAMREVGKKYAFTYKEVTYNVDGWADPKKFKPLAFDLVAIRVLRKGKEVGYNGWWSGGAWEAKRKKAEDKVIAWKRKAEAI